jgi:branched-subunit amino acid ABC-type transport system permease component
MNSLIPYIIIGLAPGAVYGLAASGLVLTYKTSGIFNFGYGALATIAAYVFYWLRIGYGLNWEISFVLSVAVLGPLMGLLMEPFARYLSVQPLIYKVTGTVGLLVSVQGLATIKYGTEALPVPSYLPLSQKTFDLFGTPFGYEQLFILAIALVVVVGLGGVFRYARTGLLMRAVVNDAELLDLEGTSPVHVRRVASVIGCTIAALSGVLILPLVGLDPLVLTLLVVQAFGAAAVGAFSNIPLTFVGGLGPPGRTSILSANHRPLGPPAATSATSC